MIVKRQNFRQAYLVFAANGLIRLNKKTIGTWIRKYPNRGFRSPVKQQSAAFIAKVHLGRNSEVQLSDKSKLHLMITVGRNIPNSMLTPLQRSLNC